MNCPKCKKIIVGNANYCSYCGEKVNVAIVNKEYDKEDLLLKSYIKEGLLSSVLDMALAGNVNAEYVIFSMIVKYGWNLDEKNCVKLEQQKDNPIAMAISGIWEIWNTVKKQEGDVAKKLERGFDLIELAAEDGDPAALYFLGTFYLGETASRYERNEMKAYRYMKKAADKKFPSAIYDLGSWYYRGENGVNKDEALGESMLMTGIHYQSFLEQDGKLSETDLSKMLKSEFVTKAKAFLRTDTKKIIKEEGEKEKFISGTEEEIQLWNEIYACETQDSLEKIKKKIDKGGYPDIDKWTAIKWIEGCILLYEQRRKAEEEKKRKEEEAEQRVKILEEKKKQMEKKRKQEEEEEKRRDAQDRKTREPAEKIINSCKTDEDYLKAMDKLKELNLPRNYFEEYKAVLNTKVKEKYETQISLAKNCDTAKAGVQAGCGCLTVMWVITVLLILLLELVPIVIFAIAVTWFIFKSREGNGYGLSEHMTECKEGKSAKEFLKKFEEKGYNIYK